MRTFFSALFGLIAMVAIVVAVPSIWITERIVDTDGFTSLIAPVAGDQQVKDYMASQITDQIASQTSLPGTRALVEPLAQRYTDSAQFPADFLDVVAQQHAWLFDEPTGSSSTMQLDITKMVNRVIASSGIGITINGPVLIPVSDGGTGLQAGSYHDAGRVVTVAGYTSAAVAVVAGLLALLIGRRRGTVLAWLGVGAVLAGVTCWVIAIYYASYVKESISPSSNSAKPVADLVIDTASNQLQHVGLITGLVGAAVVVVGVLARLVGGRR
ncbi:MULTISPECIES: hypothetical protein [unclassified Gordonia (in: high G+C Gram-positive bacteria)]